MTITPTPPPVRAENEPTTVIQPSLHNVMEYAEVVLEEAEAYGVDVSDLREELERDGLSDDFGLIDDTLQRIRDAGYLVVEQNDTLLIGKSNDDGSVPAWYENWMEA